ncbi:hypothetical protein [Marinobacterium stanieri]|uniref:Uncharacterized protein n=1 Tax=Marinobacterium stanieri TaxID=49186 RepID=A0A1N6X8W5_9GAMM|nr:hypothetical protein [Marinobacterium stanieri]SIQ98798.1 hypothetical protein SAMN05421647_11322 [Marinobacterium stanieri]
MKLGLQSRAPAIAGLAFICSISGYFPNKAYACPTCVQANSFGAEVVSNAAEGTANSLSQAAAIEAGFASLLLMMEEVFGTIQASLKAMSANITGEIERSSVLQKRMLDEYNRQHETRAQAQYITESKQYYDETYGEATLPVDSCQNYFDAYELQTMREMSEPELRVFLETYYDEFRNDHPLPEETWKYHARSLEFASSSTKFINQDQYSDGEVENAIEWVNQVVEPVPVTIINEVDDYSGINSDQRKHYAEIQSLHLRLDASKHALVDQIVMKSPLMEGEQSLQSFFAKEVYSSLNPNSLEDIAGAPPIKVMKTYLRDLQIGNAIAFSNLKENINQGRIEAVSLATISDEKRESLRLRLPIIEAGAGINDN